MSVYVSDPAEKAKIFGWRAEMDDRKQLHALVDSLPEKVLDSAEKYLQALQTVTASQ